MSWAVSAHAGSAGAFHGRPLGDVLVRSVQSFEVDGPALVLGSAQREDVVDRAACDAAGVEVVRRRSGGGAVLVEPGGLVWVDVEVPRGDPLWDDDVGRATWWLGACWAGALADLGLGDLQVHRGGLVRTTWSDLVCFAGLGPGELTDASGAKALGISQRRTRAGARFQCAVPLRWEPERLATLLGAGEALATDLADAVRSVVAEPRAVIEAFIDHLPE